MTNVAQNNILNNFSFDYKEIVIDEIALDGLEGIGINLLWNRIEKRISSTVTDKMKLRFWASITNSTKVSFYKLPEPLPHVEILDRFTIIHEDSGQLKEPDDYPDGPYEHCPINNEYGSCKYYATRTLIPHKVLKNMPYEQVLANYGDTLVIVANLDERWRALAGHLPMAVLSLLTPLHYCILELVGRARENGQMTIGKTNISKIIKDSKTLFYYRKSLQELDLIRVLQITQVIGVKGGKSLLLRLKRFHKPSILTMPKSGILYDIVDYLLKMPEYSERIEVLMKEGILTPKLSKRLQKTINIFSFAEKTIHTEDSKGKSKATKKKVISLSCESDDSSRSDDEAQEAPLKCQYKVGVDLLRQAYERFLDAGLKGLTQVQLAQLLGIEFYTSRAICRIFRMKKIVREYLEDKGKQRTARYIAVVATGKIDTKYAAEKKKLLKYLETQDTTPENEPVASTSISDDEVPRKKIKLESSDLGNMQSDDVEMATENIITEVKVLDGCEGVKPLGSANKTPTLRQLTFANGVLKVLNEKLCITGYQTLSNLASKEVNEPPMDTKSLKTFIQKLIIEGYIKLYQMKWPGVQKYSVLICARHVKVTDAVIKAKYKEICIKAATNKHLKIKKDITDAPIKSYVQYSYPRYLKIQKLHENVMRIAYFDHIKPASHQLPQGFVSIVDLIPEVTIEFVINNISTMGITEINQLKMSESELQIKLRHAPLHVYKVLMRSSSLHNAIRTNLKVLAMLGLIQLISQTTTSETTCITNHMKTSFIFYVNRHAKILDTSGTWPRPYDEGIEKSYYFNTPEDVTNYWTDVYDISIGTTIDYSQRCRKKLLPPIRLENIVNDYDNGKRYGDGKGPCGFDSGFFMEIPRLWRTFYVRPIKTPHLKKKSHAKISKFKKHKKPKPKPKPSAPVQEKPKEKIFRKRPGAVIKWTRQEDMIITMCKAAITIMSPSAQPGSLIVRNTVAKDLLAISDPRKTKGICHTRAVTLEANLSLIHEKQCIINELRRKRDLIVKYENLLKKLRLRYSANMMKFIGKAKLPMLELVWLISQVMCSKSYTQRTPCVALNVDEFHKNFNIEASTANKQCNIYKTPENSALKELILLTVMLSYGYELTTGAAKKIYATLSAYPETKLRIAVDQLRKSGAISAKDKILHNQVHRLDVEDIVQSSYKISASYQRAWSNRLNSDFVDNLANVLDEENCQREFKGSSEINCSYCELQARDLIEISSATIPVITDTTGSMLIKDEINAVNIETKFRLKSGSLIWKNKCGSSLKKLSQFFNDIDVEDILKYKTRSILAGANEIQVQINMDEDIISHLKTKAEKGSTFYELQDLCGYDQKLLKEKITDLATKNIVKIVGFNENLIMLKEYIDAWSTKFCKKYIIAYPWLTFELDTRYEIYLKWSGTVLNKVFEMPSSSITYISDKCEYITCRSVQDICMFLQHCECVKLSTVRSRKQGLFSEPDEGPEFEDYNQYAPPENILVYPTKDCMTRYAYIRKNILDKYVYDSD